MNTEIKIVSGSDKTIRFEVHIRGENVGELQTDRADLTRLADKLFDGSYIISENKQII